MKLKNQEENLSYLFCLILLQYDSKSTKYFVLNKLRVFDKEKIISIEL